MKAAVYVNKLTILPSIAVEPVQVEIRAEMARDTCSFRVMRQMRFPLVRA
jgi:hypothetical protein